MLNFQKASCVITDTTNGLRVLVWLKIFFRPTLLPLPVFLYVCYAALRTMQSEIPRHGHHFEGNSGLVFLVVLCSFVLLAQAVLQILFASFSGESLLLNTRDVIISRTLLGIGRRHTLPLKSVTGTVVQDRRKQLYEGTIAFSNGRKPFYFGAGLSPGQTEDVCRAINRRSGIQFQKDAPAPTKNLIDLAKAAALKKSTGKKDYSAFAMFWIYIGIAILSFVWRYEFIPKDTGDRFYQLWIAGVAAVFFLGYPHLRRGGRRLAQVVIFPIAVFLLFGTMYFAVQVLFPFMWVAFVLAGALILWRESRRVKAILVSLLLIPLGWFCLYGFTGIQLLLRLRTLRANNVSQLHFVPVSPERRDIVVTNQHAVETIVSSLRDTYPYSPDFEGIERPWRLIITMKDGSLLSLRVGSGQSPHPSYTWLEFGVEDYESASLRDALLKAGVHLWDASKVTKGHKVI